MTSFRLDGSTIFSRAASANAPMRSSDYQNQLPRVQYSMMWSLYNGSHKPITTIALPSSVLGHWPLTSVFRDRRHLAHNSIPSQPNHIVMGPGCLCAGVISAPTIH